MNEDTGARRRSPGRSMRVLAFGDTADEIELSALDRARQFFGDSRRLEIVPDYLAMRVGPHDPRQAEAGGKAYSAEVTVRTVEP